MKALITIALLLFSSAIYSQTTVTSTGKVALGIEVRDIKTDELIDISTLCQGFDEEGLPIKFLVPYDAMILFFSPQVTEENIANFGYSINSLRFERMDKQRAYSQRISKAKKEEVGFITRWTFSGEGKNQILVQNTSTMDSVFLEFRADYLPPRVYDIFLGNEIHQMVRNASQKLLRMEDRSYKEWFTKKYCNVIGEDGLPTDCEFPYDTRSIFFSTSYEKDTEVTISRNKGDILALKPTIDSTRMRWRGYSLTDLDPGKYIITTTNSNKKYGIKSSSFSFTIKNSFWHEQGYWLVIFTPILIILFFIYRTYTKAKINRLSLNKQLSEAELKAIRAQLNPHFLFNALNAIQNLVNKQDTDNANQYIARLSKLMRKVLAQSDDTMHTLNEEIETSTLYLELEKMRTPFTYEIKVAPEVNQNILVPSMILQPYLENAVIHGVLNGGGSHVQLNIYHDQNLCILEVSDNGTGSTKIDGNGKGLKLGEERLDIINRQSDHPVKTSVSTKALPDGGYSVTIKLPTDL